MIKNRASKSGRALIIGHYAGHGGLDANDALYFVAGSANQARFKYDTTIGALMEASAVPPETDVCLILDSCYSGAATRTTQSSNFTAELVAAVGPQQKVLDNWFALARLQNKTFTSRLTDEIAREVGRGMSTINLNDFIATLRQNSSADRMPIYQLKAGISEIRIPNLKNAPISRPLRMPTQQQRRQASFSAPSSSSALPSSTISSGMLQPSTSTPGLSAVFQVHLNNGDPTGPEAQELVEWLHSLDITLDIELLGVFRNQVNDDTFSSPLALMGPFGRPFLVSRWCVNQLIEILLDTLQRRIESSVPEIFQVPRV